MGRPNDLRLRSDDLRLGLRLPRICGCRSLLLAAWRQNLIQPLLIDGTGRGKLSTRSRHRVDRLVRQRIAVFVDERREADLVLVYIFGIFIPQIPIGDRNLGLELLDRTAGYGDTHEIVECTSGCGPALQAADGSGIVAAHPDTGRQSA